MYKYEEMPRYNALNKAASAYLYSDYTGDFNWYMSPMNATLELRSHASMEWGLDQ